MHPCGAAHTEQKKTVVVPFHSSAKNSWINVKKRGGHTVFPSRKYLEIAYIYEFRFLQLNYCMISLNLTILYRLIWELPSGGVNSQSIDEMVPLYFSQLISG